MKRITILLMFTAAITGCMTTQTMPDGSTRVSINAPEMGQLGLNKSTQSVVDGDGNVSLVPTAQGANNEPLYLAGQFNYTCAKYLVYRAQSNSVPKSLADDSCRIDYYARQEWLKRQGKSHDQSAIGLVTRPNDQKIHWGLKRDSVLNEISKATAVSFQFKGLATVGKDGKISIKPAFGADSAQDDFRLQLPASVPAIIENPADARKVADNLASRRTSIGEPLVCTGVARFVKAEDTSQQYGRYLAVYDVTSMGCNTAGSKK